MNEVLADILESITKAPWKIDRISRGQNEIFCCNSPSNANVEYRVVAVYQGTKLISVNSYTKRVKNMSIAYNELIRYLFKEQKSLDIN